MKYLLGQQRAIFQFFRRLSWRLLQLTIAVFAVLVFLAGPRVCAQTIDAIIIALPADHEFYINKEQVPRQELIAKVHTLLRELPEEKRVTYIKAAAEVRYGTVVNLINELKDRGFSVGLLANKRNQDGGDRSNNQLSQGLAPGTSETNKAGGNERLTVTVSSGRGNKMLLRVNGKPVAVHQFKSTVDAILKGSAVRNVRLIAPPMMSYGAMVEIIDLIKAGGGKPISLETTQ